MILNELPHGTVSEPDKIRIDSKKGKIIGDFVVYQFQNDGFEIAYISSLNLSGYGKTFKEAIETLEFSLNEFGHNLVHNHKSAIRELNKLGWRKDKFFNSRYKGPFIDKDGILKEFDLPIETQIKALEMSI